MIVNKDFSLPYQFKDFYDELKNRSLFELKKIIIITRTSCTFKEQVALYIQGRQSLYEVNQFRKEINIPLISQHQNKIVTNNIISKHVIDFINNDSYAVDFAILNKYDCYIGTEKAIIDDDNINDYLKLGNLGKKIIHELGYPILWGGDDKKKDLVHWEFI